MSIFQEHYYAGSSQYLSFKHPSTNRIVSGYLSKNDYSKYGDFTVQDFISLCFLHAAVLSGFNNTRAYLVKFNALKLSLDIAKEGDFFVNHLLGESASLKAFSTLKRGSIKRSLLMRKSLVQLTDPYPGLLEGDLWLQYQRDQEDLVYRKKVHDTQKWFKQFGFEIERGLKRLDDEISTAFNFTKAKDKKISMDYLEKHFSFTSSDPDPFYL